MGRSAHVTDNNKLAPRIADGNEELWEALRTFEFNPAGIPYTFSRRLARRSNWSHDFTLQVVEEYRKFLYLMRTAGHMVTPSLAVDEAWHLHLIYTQSYWDVLCMKIFKRPVHHFPGDGSDEDTEKFAAIYERTLEDYANVFGTPPVEVWGHPNHSIDWRKVLDKYPAADEKSRSKVLELLPAGDVRTAKRPLVLATEHEELWAQLQNFPFDKPGAPYPFSKRLAKRNGWDHEEALKAIDEYKKFLFLLRVTDHWVTPSWIVDETWHLHLMYTHSYWELLCMQIFKQPIHHFPGDGSDEDLDKSAATYARTLEYYQQYFGTPPVDVWPKPKASFDWQRALTRFPVVGKKYKSKLSLDFFHRLPSDEAI